METGSTEGRHRSRALCRVAPWHLTTWEDLVGQDTAQPWRDSLPAAMSPAMDEILWQLTNIKYVFIWFRDQQSTAMLKYIDYKRFLFTLPWINNSISEQYVLTLLQLQCSTTKLIFQIGVFSFLHYENVTPYNYKSFIVRRAEYTLNWSIKGSYFKIKLKSIPEP